MKSLQARLVVGTLLVTAAAFAIAGGALYFLIRRSLDSEFDEALGAKARSLAATAEVGDEGLDFEVVEWSLPEFGPSASAEYFQLWSDKATSLGRSASLEGGNLKGVQGPVDEVRIETVALPDGRPGRLAMLTFQPRLDPEIGVGVAAEKLTLVFGRDVLALRATLARVRGILVGVCVVAVAACSGGLAWLIRRGLRPLESVGQRISQIGAGDLGARIEGSYPREMRPIVDRLNDLLSRLQEAFERERRFTGDVAHELRTPLAGLRVQLELALTRDRDTQGYKERIGRCLDVCMSMQSVVENLLHLARADAGQLELQKESVDVRALVRDSWGGFAEEAASRGLELDWHVSDPCVVETDGKKLRLVLHNVFSNAVSYSNEQGRVSVATEGRNGAVRVKVSNTGCQLTADQMTRVFDRFWRADPTHGGGVYHCGLGLPLCRSIMERLGGSITADMDSSGCFLVSIELPRTAA